MYTSRLGQRVALLEKGLRVSSPAGWDAPIPTGGDDVWGKDVVMAGANPIDLYNLFWLIGWGYENQIKFCQEKRIRAKDMIGEFGGGRVIGTAYSIFKAHQYHWHSNAHFAAEVACALGMTADEFTTRYETLFGWFVAWRRIYPELDPSICIKCLECRYNVHDHLSNDGWKNVPVELLARARAQDAWAIELRRKDREELDKAHARWLEEHGHRGQTRR